jgi:hypothetical protein
MTRLEAIPELDARFSAPDATPTAAWESKYQGDWRYEVRDRAFRHEAGIAHVFEVRPHKVLAFAKGDFAQTRFRFTGGDR